MKLFYHFLFFVFASLILLACANMFNSDGKTGTSNNQPSKSEQSQNTQQANDSIAAAEEGNPYMLASFKYIDIFNNATDDEKDCVCKKHSSKLNDFQMAIMHFSKYKKFK